MCQEHSIAETPVRVAHTPGPWQATDEITRFDHSSVIRCARGMVVAEAKDFNRYDRDAERVANMHLIAAAPSLLAALEDLTRRVEAMAEDGLLCYNELAAARTAIAKARGL